MEGERVMFCVSVCTYIVMYQKSNFEVRQTSLGLQVRHDIHVRYRYIESGIRVFNSKDERMSLQNEAF